jgi:hypothetical protein
MAFRSGPIRNQSCPLITKSNCDAILLAVCYRVMTITRLSEILARAISRPTAAAYEVHVDPVSTALPSSAKSAASSLHDSATNQRYIAWQKKNKCEST